MRKSVKEGQTVSSEVVHILTLRLNKVFFPAVFHEMMFSILYVRQYP